jgi:hypothetical protein
MGFAAASCQRVEDDEEPVPAGCDLPTSTPGDGNGQLRLAHLLPTNDAIDVCVRPTGAPWKQRGVLAGSGRDSASVCSGLRYAQVTAPFKVASGTMDVKVIPAGQTCAAPSLAETMGIEVGTDFVLTLAYMGGPSVAPNITAMPETAMPKSNTGVQNRRTRFVNAIHGTILEIGISNDNSLPATMTTRVTNGVEFGRATGSTSGADATRFSVDENGYFSFPSIPLALVAVQKGTTDAILLALLNGSGNFTLYAIGDATTTFPIRGLVCVEAKSEQMLTTCQMTDLATSN